MNNAALARKLEADLIPSPRAQPAPAFQSSRISVPVQPIAAPRGFLARLWLSLFGPPAVDPCNAAPDFGVLRALYEVGADHLPSSGTWPSSRE